ncbi:MAG: deoxyribonuclease V, partial [Candidatus Caldarchaeum sp.]
MVREYERLKSYEGITIDEARKIQFSLRERVILQDCFHKIATVAGCDVGKVKGTRRLVCAITVFSFPELMEIGKVSAIADETFPYVPGYLSFREAPVIFNAWEKLAEKPDVLMCDGHGVAHPRGIGIASHVGVVLNVPTVGVAKKRLFGVCDEPAGHRGAYTYIRHPETMDIIGAALRTRSAVKPVFVSVGHCISLGSAIALTLSCSLGFRIPEPTRKAD